MPRSILVVDTNLGFTGMVQQAVVEAGFSCVTAQSAHEAIDLAATNSIGLAIIDLDLPDAKPTELVEGLRRASPGIILLGIPPDNQPDLPAVRSLGLQGTLSKPFYMPDFISHLKVLVSEAAPAAEEAPAPLTDQALLDLLGIGQARGAEPAPREPELAEMRFQDGSHASQALSQLTAPTSARACLLVREGKAFASAGSFLPDQATQAARLVGEGWSRHERGVWLRYFRLQGTEEDFLLYSTPASQDLVLAVIVEAQVPVNEARQLAHSILEGLHRTAAAAPAPPPAGVKTAILRPRKPAARAPGGSAAAGKTRRLNPDLPSQEEAREPERASVESREAPAYPSPPPAPATRVQPEKAAASAPAPAGAGESPSMRLVYNIVLTPDDPTQRMVPEMASDLEGFTRNLIVSQGWRPLRVNVRADYWMVSLSAPASSPPSEIIRTLRSQTSAHMQARFPTLPGAEASGEFWAPAHLLSTQEQPPPPGQIANFIAQTRKAQSQPSAPATQDRSG